MNPEHIGTRTHPICKEPRQGWQDISPGWSEARTQPGVRPPDLQSLSGRNGMEGSAITTRSIPTIIACILLLLAPSLPGQPSLAQPQQPAAIPDSPIAELQSQLAAAASERSSTRKRRAYKGLVRDGEGLLENTPDAPNRWQVLELMFQGQKRLLALENSVRNRAALFAICDTLVKAPDAVADLRLESDLLLSERDLSADKATVQQRTAALAATIARYRDTPGEAKSLMLAARIAPKLEAFQLEKQIEDTLDERFPGNHEVIVWRRKHRDFSHLPVRFSGRYQTHKEGRDGRVLSFPADGLGHTCLFVLWGKDSPEFAAELDRVKDLQTRFPGHLRVFSLNLDELPDAGEKLLRQRDLEWTALHLPGGRESTTYRAYATRDPLVIRANAHGHAYIAASQSRSLADETPMEQNFDDPRYLRQLQSLLIGDFLVADTDAFENASVAAKTRAAIQACFVSAPARYRLSDQEAMANYTKAARLCREVLEAARKSDTPAAELSPVRNRRIIALLGLWKLSLDPEHLAAAVAESEIALKENVPPKADANIVPRFCLTKNALRNGDTSAAELLADWPNTPTPRALAAAAILAIDANERQLHAEFRTAFLATPNDEPSLWSVRTFLSDRNHRYRLFKPNFYLPPSLARRVERANLRSNAAALNEPTRSPTPLAATLQTLDGKPFELPRAGTGKLTLLLFVEPPVDLDTAAYPEMINGGVFEDSRGRKQEIRGVMQRAFDMAAEHVNDGLEVVAAVLGEDTERVQNLMGTNAWPCQVVTVPDALDNPLVRRLGILSADRVPNGFLLDPDGHIVWQLSGLVHPQVRSEGTGETLTVVSRAMRSNIDVHGMAMSMRAFEQGAFKEAVRLFSGPFTLEKNTDGWAAPRLHGRALAQLELDNTEAALADLDAAVTAHQAAFNNRRPCVCERVASLHASRAELLETLGRNDEAAAAKTLAGAAKIRHGGNRYESFHQRLEKVVAKETE